MIDLQSLYRDREKSYTKTVTTKVNKEQYDKLKAIADTNGIKLSTLVRAVLNDFLETN